MSRKRVSAALVAVACLCACLFAFTGCDSADQGHLEGVWKVKNTDVTVVFTKDKFKMVGNEYDYSIDTSAKTIEYTNGSMEGGAKYTFDADYKQLTLDEDDGNGGTKSTVFDKVSDDTSAEPTAGDYTDDELDEGSSSSSDSSK